MHGEPDRLLIWKLADGLGSHKDSSLWESLHALVDFDKYYNSLIPYLEEVVLFNDFVWDEF
jgi:hypothetical protein